MSNEIKKYTPTEKQKFSQQNVGEQEWETELNKDLLHQAGVRQYCNQRIGTAATKTRSEVRGGGRKPWKQKGTGRARAGSRRSPLWRGGGVTFGPQPRSYEKKLNRKMARKAFKIALSQRKEDMLVLEENVLNFNKTKAFIQLLKDLEFNTGSSVLLITNYNENLYLATRNLKQVQVISPKNVGVVELLRAEHILLVDSALPDLERRVAA